MKTKHLQQELFKKEKRKYFLFKKNAYLCCQNFFNEYLVGVVFNLFVIKT